MGANQREHDEFLGLVVAHAGDGDERHPAAHAALAEERESVGYRMDFGDERKCRRIQVAQQAIAERGFGFYTVTHLVNVHLFLVYRLKNPQVIQLVGRNIVAREHFRPAEKISLEKGIAPAERALEVVVSFHFLGDETQMLFGEGLAKPLLFEFRGQQDIHFYECGKLRERQPRRGFLEIVEGDQIAHVLQAAASCDDFIVGLEPSRGLPERRDRWEASRGNRGEESPACS